MIKRVANSFRNGLCPGHELIFIGCGTCYIVFIDSIGPHGTPLIVVSLKPDGSKVFKLFIVSDFLNRQMTMVVVYRHCACVFMVQPLGTVCL